eukprot:1157626-Pelagomonas_calceolata.AAC.28
MGILKARPNPKSAILQHMMLSSTNKFWGFKSRCMTPCLWQCARPLISWYVRLCAANGDWLKCKVLSWILALRDGMLVHQEHGAHHFTDRSAVFSVLRLSSNSPSSSTTCFKNVHESESSQHIVTVFALHQGPEGPGCQ